MEQKNQRNSKKRLNSLILLVAFTAVMLIISTYAWFSTQKNVTIGGLSGEVHVAEGLQISLDAKTWVNSIDLSAFAKDASTGVWTSEAYLPGATFQEPYPTGELDGDDNPIYAKNVTPDELLPVSTTGGTNDGLNSETLKMYWGDVTEGKILSDIQLMEEEPESGYFAFDVFLQNSSASGITEDQLQLEPNSTVVVNTGKEDTGLQNTVRVGFALYNNANNTTVTVNNTPSVQQIISGTSTGKTIKDVAIWEPNSDYHVENIVNSTTQNGDGATTGILWSAADYATYFSSTDGTVKYDTDGSTVLGYYRRYVGTPSTGKSQIPTYALTSTAVTAGTIADIYNWATPSAGLKKQVTTQTTGVFDGGNFVSGPNGDGMSEEDPIQLISVAKTESAAANTDFTMTAGQYHKMRIYVWLEGQDVDCTNYASLGGGVTLDIGFSKPGSNSSGS